MPRKPVDLNSSARFPEGRQVIWEMIRKLKTFSALDIEDTTRISEHTIRAYLQGLEAAGYVRRLTHNGARDPKGRFPRRRWKLVKDVGVDAPRVTKDGKEVTQGRAREQMWRTMRVIGEFTPRDLAVHASTEEHPVNEDDARHYCRYLERARYLVAVQKGTPGHRPGTGQRTLYRLLKTRYTGPKPPMIQRVKQVFDPNLGEVVWPIAEGTA